MLTTETETLAATASATETLLTTAQGQSAIVRALSVQNTSGSPATVQIRIYDVAGSSSLQPLPDLTVATGNKASLLDLAFGEFGSDIAPAIKSLYIPPNHELRIVSTQDVDLYFKSDLLDVEAAFIEVQSVAASATNVLGADSGEVVVVDQIWAYNGSGGSASIEVQVYDDGDAADQTDYEAVSVDDGEWWELLGSLTDGWSTAEGGKQQLHLAAGQSVRVTPDATVTIVAGYRKASA